jgi:hypothetical protein
MLAQDGMFSAIKRKFHETNSAHEHRTLGRTIQPAFGQPYKRRTEAPAPRASVGSSGVGQYDDRTSHSMHEDDMSQSFHRREADFEHELPAFEQPYQSRAAARAPRASAGSSGVGQYDDRTSHSMHEDDMSQSFHRREADYEHQPPAFETDVTRRAQSTLSSATSPVHTHSQSKRTPHELDVPIDFTVEGPPCRISLAPSESWANYALQIKSSQS